MSSKIATKTTSLFSCRKTVNAVNAVNFPFTTPNTKLKGKFSLLAILMNLFQSWLYLFNDV